MEWQALTGGKKNFVFLGEAGCGKSEIAVNLACALAERGDKAVHFFDLDMTKPLFRSRDLAAELEAKGIQVHFEQQFMDAPTVTGGVMQLMRDTGSYVVMDVGGDYIGARSIGGYAPLLNGSATLACYVINSYRPWSLDLEHIDGVLGQVLGVSHLQLENISLVTNCNLGLHTTAQDVVDGSRKVCRAVSPYKPVLAQCVWERLLPEVKSRGDWLPLHLYLTYPWEKAV